MGQREGKKSKDLEGERKEKKEGVEGVVGFLVFPGFLN